MLKRIPVYLITGFMDGGKTTMIKEEEQFCKSNLEKILKLYQPDIIFIEYNGMWEYAPIVEELPENLFLGQVISVADATTFEMYMMNMRILVMEQMFMSEAVIFNRCDDQTPRQKFRAMIKNFNRPAQIIFERADGKIEEGPEKMPFDLNADVIEITDADYALWMM